MGKDKDCLSIYLETVKNEVSEFVDSIEDENFRESVELITNAEKDGNRVHITGIGKPGHVAGYVASLLSSTGTPTYELHGTEAVHGSCGQVLEGDVVIAISNSGETNELKATVTALKNNGAKIISVTGNRESWLAKNGDSLLYAGVSQEGGPLNKAPRASILAELIVLQGLSVVLQGKKEISPEQYVKWHPSGALGKLK